MEYWVICPECGVTIKRDSISSCSCNSRLFIFRKVSDGSLDTWCDQTSETLASVHSMVISLEELRYDTVCDLSSPRRRGEAGCSWCCSASSPLSVQGSGQCSMPDGWDAGVGQHTAVPAAPSLILHSSTRQNQQSDIRLKVKVQPADFNEHLTISHITLKKCRHAFTGSWF